MEDEEAQVNRYRKKPVVIDAIQWTGINVQEVLGWLAEMVIKFKKPAQITENSIIVEEAAKIKFDLTAKPHIKLTVSTLNGDMVMEHGEFLLCGVQGEFYPCKADIFEATYDKVHPDYVESSDTPFTFQTCKGCGEFLDSCQCSWNFDHKKADRLIMEARSREYSKHELELADLLERAKDLDSERRTYYDSFRLVQEDRQNKMAAMAKLAPALKAFRESNHSYDRAPTPEGQAVLDAWDEVAKILSR